jgi:outer membrane protein assembly factor BamE
VVTGWGGWQGCLRTRRHKPCRYNEGIISPERCRGIFMLSMHLLKLPRARQPALAALGAVALFGLTACGSVDSASSRLSTMISPYKIDIVQGNFVSREQAAALRPGMSKLQVRDLLGTPLLVSLFHADRWDYVFTFKRQGAEPQLRKVTVYFRGDALERFEADNLPTETEFVASMDSGRRDVSKKPVLEASEESLAKFASPAKPAAPAVEASRPLPPLPERYPPLEPATR